MSWRLSELGVMRSLFLLLLCLFEIVRNKAAKYINICVGIHTHIHILHTYGLPEWLSDKESACQAGDVGLIPGLGISPGKGNGNPLQCSCLENPMDGGALQVQSMGLQRVRHD